MDKPVVRRTLTVLALLGVSTVVSVGCWGATTGGGGAEPIEPEATVSVKRECAAYCGHLRELRCPTKGKSSCEDVCAEMMTGPVPWHLACRKKAPSCTAIDECER